MRRAAAATTDPLARSPRDRRGRWPADRPLARWGMPVVLLAPSVVLILILFAYPLLRLVVQSFTQPSLGWGNYASVVRDPVEWRIIRTTIEIAAECTLASLLLAYPVAFLLASLPRRRANLLLILVLLPFWTSLLVRMYAWMVLLGRQGVINSVLVNLHLAGDPYPLLYDRFAVVVGMTHYLLPFMVLSLYSTMVAIDPSLLQAARSMGSSTFQAFSRVYLPLSMPGVYAGCLLVFILAIGFFVTPALLGGPHDMTIAVYIQQRVELLEWGQATAMAVILLVLVVVLFAIYDRLLGFERLFRGIGSS
jgi:ABC-type spermidine/putrescine transport system permease subunit I